MERQRTWAARAAGRNTLLSALLLSLLAVSPTDADTPPRDARGEQLYQRYCVTCHGKVGQGDGEAAYLLYPKPRDFTRMTFRLISTDNGVASDEDILKVLERGMPGSAMPPWNHLGRQDLKSLVRHVRRLAYEGIARRLEDDGDDREEAEEIAAEDTEAGASAELPRRTPPSARARALGKQVYARACASCHGADGRGRVSTELKDDDGYPIKARDFTSGIFKGGSSETDILRRVFVGMPGTPMPSFVGQVKTEEFWPLVHHIRSLIKPGAEARVLQKKKHIFVKKASGKLPTAPDDRGWRGVESTYVALMPLWWRDDRVEGVEVQAVHDRRSITVKLSWEDPTRDSHILDQTSFGDGAAIQLAPGDDPPVFSMGDPKTMVNIWHWKAYWETDIAGFRDVEARHPYMAWDLYPELEHPPYGRHAEVSEFKTAAHKPAFLTGRGAGNPVSQEGRKSPVESGVARGFGTFSALGKKGQNVRGKGRWKDGRWEVVFVRKLSGSRRGEVVLQSGERMSLGLRPPNKVSAAFAVWDGSAGDRNGQKLISIWHRLVLQ